VRGAGFLNVDLEVGARTRAQLLPLLDALACTLFELYRGRVRSRYCGFYEISGCGPMNVSATIRQLLDVIDGLAAPARRAWDTAAMRDFNVGVELERGVRSIELAIDADVIGRVAALGGRIAFTAYQVAAMSRPRRTGRRRTGRKPARA
jgi:hypothetical protein